MNKNKPDIKWNSKDSTLQNQIAAIGYDAFIEILTSLFSNARELAVEPLVPGKSGALVFKVCTVSEEGIPEIPRVVKIGKKETINEEQSNYERFVREKVTDYPALHAAYLASGTYGGVAYSFVGIRKPQTFTRAFLSAQTSGEQIPLQLIDRLFNSALSNWMRSMTCTRLQIANPKQGFYLSRSMFQKFKSAALQLMPDSTRELYMLQELWDGLEQEPLMETFVCPVHGDLHGDNVLTNEHGQIFLIDFAHTKRRHFLNDFTKFEANLRFRLIPPLSNEETKVVWRQFDDDLPLPGSTNPVSSVLKLPEELRLGHKCISLVRRIAAATMQTQDRSPEFLLGLIKHAIPMLFYTDSEITVEHRHRVLHTVFSSVDRLRRTPLHLSGKRIITCPAELTVNIPITTGDRLFGVDDRIDLLCNSLIDTDGPRFISLEGFGGLGKTAIASAATRRLAEQENFAGIAWETVREHSFHDSESENLSDSKHELPAILATLARQLRWDFQSNINHATHFLGRLASARFLIVIDNFETSSEIKAILTPLLGSGIDIGSSKVLVTTRASLEKHKNVKIIPATELNLISSIALLRHEAARLNIQSILDASDDSFVPIMDAVGGNPLALKLIAAQLKYLPLNIVLDSVSTARGDIRNLYNFIYRKAWTLLSEDARDLLRIMPQFSDTGATWAELDGVTGLSLEPLTRAVKELTEMSLLVVGGALNSRSYSIHRLTRSFLVEEVVRWKTET